jgi:hypothetical protein
LLCLFLGKFRKKETRVSSGTTSQSIWLWIESKIMWLCGPWPEPKRWLL